MVRCGSKQWHQKDTSLEKIWLHAQNTLTILDSIVNMILEDLCDHSMSTKIFTLIMNKIFISAQKIWKKVATALIWNFKPISFMWHLSLQFHCTCLTHSLIQSTLLTRSQQINRCMAWVENIGKFRIQNIYDSVVMHDKGQSSRHAVQETYVSFKTY